MAPPIRYPNTEARRAAVKAELAHHGKLTMTQRRSLAEQFQCTPGVIAHDMEMVRDRTKSLQPPVLPVESYISYADERDVAVMRALGRLEVMTSKQLKTLVFPDLTIRSMRKQSS